MILRPTLHSQADQWISVCNEITYFMGRLDECYEDEEIDHLRQKIDELRQLKKNLESNRDGEN